MHNLYCPKILFESVKLQQLVANSDEGMTKVITGIRRCVKSFLLFTIFKGYYIQVAYDMISEEKQIQEFNSLRNIPDSFKKIVNGSKKPWRNDDGFAIMGMKYFLLNEDSLEY